MLSKRLGLLCFQLDNFLKKIDDPELLFYDGNTEFWYLSSQELCERLVRVTEQAERYLHSLVTEWLTHQKVGIIEGEKIHPRLVEQLAYSSNTKGVFIIESNRKRLYQTLQQRSQSFRELGNVQRWQVVEMNRLYGLWLRSEAEQRDLAWVNSQPWESLTDRIVDQIL